MSWPLIFPVTRDAPGDGVSMPRWSGGNDVHPEPADGPVDALPVSRIAVALLRDGIQSRIELSGISARLSITDSRVTLACRRFEPKGGGWIGFGVGALFALVANLVSKALAASRNVGRAAVGHVRYEWITLVGWRSKASGGAADDVRIGFRAPDGSGETLLVDVRVPRDLDPALVALEISRRVARHRLRHRLARTPETWRRCLELADGRVIEADPAGFAVLRIPPVETADATPARQETRS